MRDIFLLMTVLPLQTMAVLFAVPVCSLRIAYLCGFDHLPLVLIGQPVAIYLLKSLDLQVGKYQEMFVPCWSQKLVTAL